VARAKPKPKPKPVSAPADPSPVFPESAFVGLFADYRQLVAPTTEAPDAFHWASLLASLSALVGRSAKLEGGPDGVTPLLHVALLGRTGKARKSTAMEDAVSLFVDLLPAAIEVLADARARAQLQVVDGDHLRVPTRDRSPATNTFEFTLDVVRGAGSGEGLAEALADKDDETGKRALFVIDEFGALLEKAGRGQAGNLVELLLRLYDAPTKFEHRTRKASFSVTNGVGVFLGASTVEWVHRTLTEAHVRRGLVSRFIWVLGDRKPKPLARRPAIDKEGHQAFLVLAAERLSAAAGKTFSLTAEADALHQQRYELEYHRSDETDLQSAASARADGLALRLSLLLAIADGAKKVGLAHIEAAWGVVDYSRDVSGNLVEHIGTKSRAGAESRVLTAAHKTAEATRGAFTRRDVFQRVKGATGVPTDVFERAWKALVANGELVAAQADKWKLAKK
jgi:hypothetical protein